MEDRDHRLNAVGIVQNPALGSVLLWHFGKEFQNESVAEVPVLNLHLLVLPLLLHAKTLDVIKSTFPSSGLGQVVNKLSAQRELVLSIHHRACSMRELSMNSISTGVSSRLLSVNYETARVRSNDAKPPSLPESLKYHTRGAEKLGLWFARISAPQVFSLLQVEP